MIITPKNISTSFQFTSIISLVPSITELLSDLGLEDEIVGITKFCIHPANWYRNKTRGGGTKNVNIEMVHSLSPDLIIANKEENERKQVEELACSYSVLLTDVTDLESALRMIGAIGIITNKKQKATQLIKGIKTSFGRIRFQLDKKKKLKTKKRSPKTVKLNFTTARGIILLNVNPNEVPSNLTERPLTEAAKAIIRSGDSLSGKNLI